MAGRPRDRAAKPRDVWSFVEYSTQRLAENPDLDIDATRLILTLNRASDVITYDLESTVHRPQGHTWAAFRLLFVTWLAGPFDATTAARLTGMSRAAVSSLTKTLVADGLLERRPDPHDGRSVELALTDAGQGAMRRIFAEHNRREEQWAAALTKDEQAQLVALLSKLIQGQHTFDARGRN